MVIVTDGDGALGDKEGLDSFYQAFKTLLFTEGGEKVQQCDLEQKITYNVNSEGRSRRLGVTTVLRRAETEEHHGDTVGRTDLLGSQLRGGLS